MTVVPRTLPLYALFAALPAALHTGDTAHAHRCAAAAICVCPFWFAFAYAAFCAFCLRLDYRTRSSRCRSVHHLRTTPCAFLRTPSGSLHSRSPDFYHTAYHYAFGLPTCTAAPACATFCTHYILLRSFITLRSGPFLLPIRLRFCALPPTCYAAHYCARSSRYLLTCARFFAYAPSLHRSAVIIYHHQFITLPPLVRLVRFSSFLSLPYSSGLVLLPRVHFHTCGP